jgi:hypothetical protein
VNAREAVDRTLQRRRLAAVHDAAGALRDDDGADSLFLNSQKDSPAFPNPCL